MDSSQGCILVVPALYSYRLGLFTMYYLSRRIFRIWFRFVPEQLPASANSKSLFLLKNRLGRITSTKMMLSCWKFRYMCNFLRGFRICNQKHRRYRQSGDNRKNVIFHFALRTPFQTPSETLSIKLNWNYRKALHKLEVKMSLFLYFWCFQHLCYSEIWFMSSIVDQPLFFLPH